MGGDGAGDAVAQRYYDFWAGLFQEKSKAAPVSRWRRAQKSQRGEALA